MRLSVKYKIPLSGYLMFCLDEKSIDKVIFNLIIDGYDIEIYPLIDKGCYQKKGDEKYSTYCANELIFIATKEFEGDESDINWHLIKKYENIAEKITNRFLRYFQYRLNNPLIRLVDAHDDSWSNSPVLINEENNKILSPKISCDDYSKHFAYGYYPRFGIVALTDMKDDGLFSALNNDINPLLYEDFLCSARTEIIEGNIRRATLEMAISCEVFVKSSLFSESAISGSIFDYLSTQRKIEVSVQELLHKPIKEVCGSSFKEEHLQDWKNICYLFNARNRVAHSGLCEFRNEKGEKLNVDEFIIEEWWGSFEKLISWLNKKLKL